MKFLLLCSSNPIGTAFGMQHGLKQGGHVADMFFADKWKAREIISMSDRYDSIIVCKGTMIRNLDEYQMVFSKVADSTYFIPDVVNRGKRADSVGPRGMICTRIVCTGTEAAKWYRDNGYSGRIAQIYQGYRPHIWQPGEGPGGTQDRVSFLGSFYKDDGGREFKLKSLQNKGYKILVRNNIFHKEAASIYWTSAININFSAWDCTSNRAIRVMASGGFLLTEWNRDIEATFEPGNQLDWFKTEKEMQEKVKFYINNPDVRRKIAKRGRDWAKERDWTSQMNKIVKFIQGEEDFCDGDAREYTSETL